ncbi:hypothetical protein [Streptococcus marmotae]|uniref:hypothetical protein n=1 Tax=Streptococcus marmotae TaxID=1825069 RepID=UPI000AB8490E|nr:hypothetical protein [Streptococcus marmotae]
MDEGTSALDKENSENIRNILANLNSTVIEVAHHFSEEAIQKHKVKHLSLSEQTLLEV